MIEVPAVVDDQFLRETLGIVGNRRVVLQDDFDFLAGDGVALLLHVQLDRIVDLLAGRGLAAGHRQDQADLHALLRPSRRNGGDARKYNAGSGPRQRFSANEHERSPPDRFSAWNRVSRFFAFTIAQIFQPCMGAAWRLMRATMSISTMGVIAVAG